MAKTERIQNMTKGSPAKLIFTFAIPLMLGNVFQQFYTVVDTAIVGQALGVNALAALGAADWLNWLVLGLIQGFAQGFSIYMAQRFGAGLLDRVKKGMHSATWIALLTSVVITVFVLIFGKYGIALFISGTAEEVSISSQVAIHYLNIMSICLSILYMLHIYRSALMGLGDTIMPMASGIMEFLMRIGVALFLPLIIGQEGIFYAEVTAWTGAAILLVTTYFLRMHKLTRELDTSQSKAGE